ncbi:MAG: hypothetical protein A2086_05915 [Spirochaetes bacterium GWD1_27_9]|nr:MAG: hypothetical protein A2Z98_17675 [Spirochaetes bacterium GWB1_27_13]OHD35536.1 MAG: hypothetical protein A2086_05915 [Spirochaetes bacterium GWD1_27_9]
MAKRGNKKFLDALLYSDVAKAKEFLEQGADPNTIDDYGHRVLSTACWYCNEEIVNLLLGYGAEPNGEGGKALFNAAKSNNDTNIDVIQILLDKGADINTFFNFEAEEISGNAIMVAIYFGNVNVAYKLLKNNIDLNVKNEDDDTPFSLACEAGFYKLAKTMLQKGMKPDLSNDNIKELYEYITKNDDLNDSFMDTVYCLEFMEKGKSPHYTGDPDLSKVYNGTNFFTCNNPPVHLLTLDLTKIKELPDPIKEIGILNVVFHNCDDCDPPDFADFLIEKDGKLEPIENEDDEDIDEDEDDTDTSEDYKKEYGKDIEEDDEDDDDYDDEDDGYGECDPESYTNSEKITYLSLKKDMEYCESGITIGGLPNWAQYPQWASCGSCGKIMFYIGSIYQYSVPPTAEGMGNHLYIFVCPDCRELTIVRQMT